MPIARRKHDARRSTARVAPSLPDPRDLDLSDLELARRHAARRRRRSRALRRAVVDARRARLGRGVVGPADDVADRVAPLLGAPRGLGVDAALDHDRHRDRPRRRSQLDPAARKVVTTDLHFPSILYLLERWCGERGAALEIVRREPGAWGVALDRLLEAIDDTTAVVSLSHVEFASAWLYDARALARRCREVGAFLVLDIFQSAGVLPARAARVGRRRRRRRLPQVAVRRAGQLLSLRRSRSRRDPRARDHRLGRARGAVRLRAAADPLARRRRPVRQRHAAGAGALCRARRSRHPRRDRRRSRAREVGRA